MQCTQCHAIVHPTQKFCPACGAPVPEQSTPSSIPSTSPVTAIPLPIAVTTDRSDFWTLGGLAILAISLFLPFLTGPAHFSIAPIRIGFFAWLGFLVALAYIVVTAIPSLRPHWWIPVNRWLSAATVGATVAISVLVLSLSSLINHAISQFMSSAGAFGSLLSGNTTTLHISLGIGILFALAGSITWTIMAWRSPSKMTNTPHSSMPPVPSSPTSVQTPEIPS